MSEWIAHDGGVCPVVGNPVEIKYRKGSSATCIAMSFAMDAWQYASRNISSPYDIIAYRLVDPIPSADIAASHSQECVAVEGDGRKHVSDAAWERAKKWSHYVRVDAEKWYGEQRCMLVTVEEWDEHHDPDISTLIAERDQALARVRDAQIHVSSMDEENHWIKQRCRWLEAELERLRKGVMPNAETKRVSEHAVTGAAHRTNAGLLTMTEPTHRMGGDRAR